ncbi:DUF982 domain-containing protein [Mesorhizobium sp. ORM6]
MVLVRRCTHGRKLAATLITLPLNQWESTKLAMDVCLQVLRGEGHSPAARRAFVAAAQKAKILRSD